MTELTPDLAYSPSHFSTAFEATLTRQAAAGRALRARHQPIILAYGDDPAACLHLFIPPGEGPWPLMVFIHGGYWQELDHTATDFLAERSLARGMAFASIGYGLAPTTTIDTMIAQCIQGLEAVSGVNYLVRSATTMMAGLVALRLTLFSLLELLLSPVAFPL